MIDYLQPVRDGLRRVAAAACLLAALVAATITGFVAADMMEKRRLDQDGKPLWAGVLVCGLIAAACGWFAVRLGRGRSANGVTILPVWAIEVFGVLFLAGVVWVGVDQGLAWGGPAVSVPLAMILVRRAVRQRAPFVESAGPGQPDRL